MHEHNDENLELSGDEQPVTATPRHRREARRAQTRRRPGRRRGWLVLAAGVAGLITLGSVAGIDPTAGTALASTEPDVGDVVLDHDITPKERTAPTTEAPPYSTDRTFVLHSKPGATRKIFLDFTGHTTSGTSWNTGYNNGQPITSKPFDDDGNPSSFSAAEHRAIQRTWLAVREDFAPFDVDVTTEDPGTAGLTRASSTDLSYGHRVVISPTTTWCDDERYEVDDVIRTGCPGGWARLHSFGGPTDVPSFVFSDGGPLSPRWLGKVSSHEVGHSLGLHHDGLAAHEGDEDGAEYATGHGTWSPIMGTGARAVTQWSKGEYAHANNAEDDLAIIQQKLPRRTDDYAGDTTTTATMKFGDVRYGVISSATDTDAFRFTLAQSNQVTITVRNDTAGMDPNLNARVVVKNRAGTVITTAVPTSTMGADFRVNLPPGEYFIYVNGMGEGAPLTTGYSAYGSLGFYSIELGRVIPIS
jgi:hypothetical protein